MDCLLVPLVVDTVDASSLINSLSKACIARFSARIVACSSRYFAVRLEYDIIKTASFD